MTVDDCAMLVIRPHHASLEVAENSAVMHLLWMKGVSAWLQQQLGSQEASMRVDDSQGS